METTTVFTITIPANTIKANEVIVLTRDGIEVGVLADEEYL